MRRVSVLVVRDHLPLKQGLRLHLLKFRNRGWCVRDHLPLKQGLRLRNSWMLLSKDCPRPSSIKTRIKTSHTSLELRELHLGPRPSSIKTRIKTKPLLLFFAILRACPRPSSIKTRIKTRIRLIDCSNLAVRDHLPLKQGLRPSPLSGSCSSRSETIFH